jgi:hypothetical protein
MKIIIFIMMIPSLIWANGEVYSPNMSMPIPTVGVTKGPTYATDINSSLLILDSHNHTPGSGVQITPSGLNINSDLSMANNNLTNIRTTRFSSSMVPITSASPDISALYSVLGDLYYNDASGHQIQMTSGGSVAGSSGTITGLPSGTASASYVSLGGTFKFNQTSSLAANIDAGTYVLRYPGSYPTPTGNYIAFQAPSSLSTGYALTYPATLPSATGYWMTSDTSGAMSWTGVDNSSLQYASNVVSVKALGVTGSMIANNTITTNQISNSAAITGTQMASATITGSNIAASTITGSNIAITTVDYGNITAVNYASGAISNGTYGNGNTLVSLSFSANNANPVMITLSSLSPTGGMVGSSYFDIKICRGAPSPNSNFANISFPSGMGGNGISIVPTPSIIGTRTYTLTLVSSASVVFTDMYAQITSIR